MLFLQFIFSSNVLDNESIKYSAHLASAPCFLAYCMTTSFALEQVLKNTNTAVIPPGVHAPYLGIQYFLFGCNWLTVPPQEDVIRTTYSSWWQWLWGNSYKDAKKIAGNDDIEKMSQYFNVAALSTATLTLPIVPNFNPQQLPTLIRVNRYLTAIATVTAFVGYRRKNWNA